MLISRLAPGMSLNKNGAGSSKAHKKPGPCFPCGPPRTVKTEIMGVRVHIKPRPLSLRSFDELLFCVFHGGPAVIRCCKPLEGLSPCVARRSAWLYYIISFV